MNELIVRLEMRYCQTANPIRQTPDATKATMMNELFHGKKTPPDSRAKMSNTQPVREVVIPKKSIPWTVRQVVGSGSALRGKTARTTMETIAAGGMLSCRSAQTYPTVQQNNGSRLT